MHGGNSGRPSKPISDAALVGECGDDIRVRCFGLWRTDVIVDPGPRTVGFHIATHWKIWTGLDFKYEWHMVRAQVGQSGYISF